MVDSATIVAAREYTLEFRKLFTIRTPKLSQVQGKENLKMQHSMHKYPRQITPKTECTKCF